MQAWRAREWSWPMSAQHRWPKDKRHWWIVSDRSGCPIRDRTTSLETKSVQWIWRMRLRHQLSSASTSFYVIGRKWIDDDDDHDDDDDSNTDYAFTQQKPTQRWREAPDRNAGVLPGAVISDLMQRDLSDHDYELLLQLDKSAPYNSYLLLLLHLYCTSTQLCVLFILFCWCLIAVDKM